MRQGDIVAIRATLKTDPAPGAEQLYVMPHGHYTSIFVDAKDAELILPFFKEGERVRKINNPEITGTIVATFDGDCWVDLDRGNRGTIKATDLEPLREGNYVAAA